MELAVTTTTRDTLWDFFQMEVEIALPEFIERREMTPTQHEMCKQFASRFFEREHCFISSEKLRDLLLLPETDGGRFVLTEFQKERINVMCDDL